jgi:hypothetical protein
MGFKDDGVGEQPSTNPEEDEARLHEVHQGRLSGRTRLSRLSWFTKFRCWFPNVRQHEVRDLLIRLHVDWNQSYMRALRSYRIHQLRTALGPLFLWVGSGLFATFSVMAFVIIQRRGIGAIPAWVDFFGSLGVLILVVGLSVPICGARVGTCRPE